MPDPKPDYDVMMGRRPCPRAELHTPMPEDYLEWFDAVHDLAPTHTQSKCPGCGLWKIWTPKPVIESPIKKEQPIGKTD